MKHTIPQELNGIAIFLALLWGVFLLDLVLPGDFTLWGLQPRTAWGLTGIPLAPFLHGGLGHLLSNTIPLAILLLMMAGSRAETWSTVAEIVLLGGALLWLFGRSANHVGASGLVYGLIAFLIVAGFREKRMIPLLVALLVGFLYGGTLLYGVLPTAGTAVSWDGHLCGAVAGAILGAIVVSRSAPGAESKSEGPPLELA